MIFLFSILISVYHFSIEQGFIDESAVCKSKNLNLITKDDILNSLSNLKFSDTNSLDCQESKTRKAGFIAAAGPQISNFGRR